jgi:hypothetical protein
MPDELVSKILDVVAHSPPHVNPYDTVIEVLKKHLEVNLITMQYSQVIHAMANPIEPTYF